MSKYLHLCAILSLAIFSLTARAYHLDDHERITRQAYAEFKACFPAVEHRLPLQYLVNGDLDEDTNLLVKELFYSHFYNPNKELQQWRKGSDGRIENLEPGLLQCRTDVGVWTEAETMSLGYAIHHFQDMSVPSHVVPVNHSLWDGFEVYKLPGDISSEWSCDQITASYSEDLLSVLKETAQTTLLNVADFHVEVLNVDARQTGSINGSDFWLESQDDSFGAYGRLGNVFGTTNFQVNGVSVRISDDAYRDFKTAQEKLAVRATLRGLVWAMRTAPVTN